MRVTGSMEHGTGGDPAWERQLWTGRPGLAARLALRDLDVGYVLTDLRLTIRSRDGTDDLLVQDIADVRVVKSRLDRVFGTSTLVVRFKPSARGRAPILMHSIRRGDQLAALLELAAAPRAAIGAHDVDAALAWDPARAPGPGLALAGLIAVLVTVFALSLTLHGRASTITYSADDPIAPNGVKRSRADIVRFMETEVMPWARTTLGPIVGGADKVRCETCHGQDADARDWRMPGVAALPQPAVVDAGWERASDTMDSQTRNAIYGYNAEPRKQGRAVYMREHVLPGMAKLLHRPAYDFTKSYDYNRSQLAFGCYHCHRVSRQDSTVESRN
jgi:hypothetical protein